MMIRMKAKCVNKVEGFAQEPGLSVMNVHSAATLQVRAGHMIEWKLFKSAEGDCVLSKAQHIMRAHASTASGPLSLPFIFK